MVDGLPAEEVEANCNLLIAGPDMLAALVEALTLWDDNPKLYETAGGTLEVIQAAIAKAEGR